MAQPRSLIQCTIAFDAPGFQTGALRVPYSHDRSAYGHIPIPIAVLNGSPGPTVLLTGGNHGDEFEGPLALMKLLQDLPKQSIRGRVIVVPALNFPAFLKGARTSPIDGCNLNRIFPGQRNGSVSEMIAHYVDSELFPLADIVVDLHAGGASFSHMPMVLAALPADSRRHDEYIRLIDAFGAPHTMLMDLLGEDRTYGAAVERHGKLFVCGEFGGFGTCDVDGLRIVEHGLARLLRAAGVIDATSAPDSGGTHLIRVDGARHYLFAPEHGVFEPMFKLGDAVQAGQPAGRLFDPHAPWQSPRLLRFESDGMVVCIRSFTGVEPGDCIALLARDADWA